MSEAKGLFQRLVNWQYAGLCLIVLLTLVLHFSVIVQPDEPAFDEKFYVTDARLIIDGKGTERTEHPPLGKLFIVSGMLLFGDNPMGWRFFPVVFGAGCIIFFYLICRRLNMSPKSSFLATFLLAFENLGFTQASVAMLDVFSLTFMLASFYLYLKGRYIASGISAGLSALTKLSGALALPVILLHWFFTSRPNPRRFLASMLSAPATFLLLMPLLEFIIRHKFVSPFEQTARMLDVTVASTFAKYPSEMLSRPWDWVLQPKIITYWLDPHYIGMISPSLWVFIIPVVIFLVFKAIKGSNTATFALAWFTGTYLIWIPVNLVTDRIMYIYYFYPTIGAICIGLALALSRISGSGSWQTGKLMIPVYLLLHLATFVILTPMPYWWKVPGGVAAYALARFYLKE